MENKIHLWQGQWIDDAELRLRSENLALFAQETFAGNFPTTEFLDACNRMGNELKHKGKLYNELLDAAIVNKKMSREEIASMFEVITGFMNKDVLVKKMVMELGTDEPFEIKRNNFKEHQFEGYAPLGTVVHIAPSNVFTVSVLCLVEGLLTGNMNFLKTSAAETLLPQVFFSKLFEFDKSGKVKNYVIIARISSKESDLLRQILSHADGVSAWGSEEAIKSLSEMAPDNTKFIKWGHKISFGYISREMFEDEAELSEMAKDVCRIEQQACSSPQNIYIEASESEELFRFANKFAEILSEVSAQFPLTEPEFNFRSEITNVVEVAKAEEALGLTKVIEARDKSFRVIADTRKALRASPLFRTIWIKPILPEEIIETLYPMRNYLQTAGLSAPLNRLGELSGLLFKAGVLRINRAGGMLEGYIGEPHDGKFALREMVKRISVNLGNKLEGYSSINEFIPQEIHIDETQPVLTKEGFQNMDVSPEDIELIVKSGGSSGKTVYSYFTWYDYHTQMANAAHGLYAAGLDPMKDSVINLFAAGNLYGGFISFWTILEMMEIRQYPMGMVDDLSLIADTIIKNRINSIISAPSFIIKLFEANEAAFAQARVVKKVFYGGEHLTLPQRHYLQEKFGVEIIRSAVYGSNDAGPLGFQCCYCQGSEHHLLTNLQEMEILKLDTDEPAEKGEPGRIILTSRKRKGQKIERYEIGDIGRLKEEKCKCGRAQPLFELLGRTGDVFKAGGPFLNYNSFVKTLSAEFSYFGNTQIILENTGKQNTLKLRLENTFVANENLLKEKIITADESLDFSIRELGLIFEIEKIPSEKFDFVTHSGKLKKIIDKRI